MTNPIKLAIDIAADPSAAARGFDKIGTAADGMADSVQQAARDSAAAASKLDRVAGSADLVDDKAGRATGAMGALAAGFEFLGAENAAAGLESAAMATDGLSGAGQALGLVLELEAVKTVKAKAATVAKTVADKAAAAATKVVTAAQWLFNAAMSANPIGLVVLAVVALVGVLALLYTRSSTVRSIVQAVGRAGARAFSAVVDAVKLVVSWVKDKVPPAFQALKTAVITVVKIATIQIRLIIAVVRAVAERAPAVFAAMKDAIVSRFVALKERAGEVFDTIRQGIANAIGKAVSAVGNAKTRMVEFFGDLLRPVQLIIDKVQSLIDKLKNIDLPSIDLNPLGRQGIAPRLAPLPSSSSSGGDLGGGQTIVNITVTGALDPVAVARQIQSILYTNNRTMGLIA